MKGPPSLGRQRWGGAIAFKHPDVQAMDMVDFLARRSPGLEALRHLSGRTRGERHGDSPGGAGGTRRLQAELQSCVGFPWRMKSESKLLLGCVSPVNPKP